MSNRCEVCPLRGEPEELSCPGIWDWPGWCGHVRTGHHHFTADKLIAKSGQPRPRTKAEPIDSKFPEFRPPDGRTRAGFVSAGAFLGGAEMHGSNLFDYCDGSMVRWEGIAVQHQPSIPTIPTVIADWEEHAPVRFGLAAIAELARKVDVLVTWGIQSQDLERLIPKDLPVIEISHCAFDYGQSHCAMPRSKVVAVSRAALRGVPPARRSTATIIHNAVSPDRVRVLKSRAEVRAAWGVPDDAMVALQTSRLSWSDKNPSVWIDGINRLPGRWRGVWPGAGLDEQRIREYAAKVSPHRVVFPGPTDDVGSAMAAADCMVMTSGSEGYCYAIAEAWRFGLPVISKAVGVFEEDSRFARLLPPDATGQDVALAVVRDEFDAEGTADRVSRARAFAETSLSIEEFNRRWTDLIVSTALTRPVNLHKRNLELVRTCPHRGEVVPGSGSCNCTRYCLIGKGSIWPGDDKPSVSTSECLKCVGTS